MYLFPDINTLLAFIAACWVLQISPGPDMMVVINNSIQRGALYGLYAVFGIFLGILLQAPLLTLGTATLVSTYSGAFDLIRLFGATYLGYLAYKNFRLALRSHRGNKVDSSNVLSNPAFEGFITNISNPNVILFLFAFIPQFTAPEKGDLSYQLLIFLVILKLNGLLVNGGVALLASRIGRQALSAASNAKWIHLFSGIVFTLISASFIYQSIN